MARKNASLTELGLAPGATVAEIKTAYRALARRWHPDVGGDAVTFDRLTKAYHAALVEAAIPATEVCRHCRGTKIIFVQNGFFRTSMLCPACHK